MAKVSKLCACLFLILLPAWLVYGTDNTHISIRSDMIKCHEYDAAATADLRKWCPSKISGHESIADGLVLRYHFSDSRCPIQASTVAFSVAMQDHVRTLEWKQFVAHQIQAVVNECVIVKGIAGTLKRQVIIGEDIVYLVIHVGYGLSTFSSSVSTSDEEVPSINGQRRGLSPFSFVKRICTQCKEMATIEDTLHRKNCAAAWAKVSNTALVLVGYYLSREEPQRAGLFNIAGNAIGIVPEFINFCNTEDVRDRCVAAAGMLHKVLSSVVTGAGMYVEDRRVTGVGMSLAAGQLVYMPDLLKLCMAKPTEDRTAHRQSTEPTTTVPPRLNP